MYKKYPLLLLVFLSFSPLMVFTQTLLLPPCKNKFVVIAHRGDHTHAPENTLAAFQNAIDAGADFVEIDLRTTKDSQLIIMHDATVDRMTDFKGRVKDLNLDTLQRMKVWAKQHPEWGHHAAPTFKQVLQLCKGKINIYLDFKDASVELAYKEIVAAGMEHHIIVYINTSSQFTDWRKVAPKMPLMISLPKAIKTKEDMFQLLDTTKVDILDGNFNEYTIETVSAAKKKNVPVWADIQAAVEGAERWDKALATGLTGLQTDHPKDLIDYLLLKGIR
jgi:glycerophosphoryl diester phosphodiesterase